MTWVTDRQLLNEYGDWKIYRPNLAAGGWAFEYNNSWFPDIDDTAAVLLALLKQSPENALTQSVERAVAWILGMQSRDGGWAAFDADNDKDLLNDHPFCDMSSLCDPSTPDVTGRVLEALGIFRNRLQTQLRSHANDSRAALLIKKWQNKINAACDRALIFLRRTQETQGSWYGRWGVNYIYGTSNVLCGLGQMNSGPGKIGAADPMILQGLTWLKHVQNGDGGWGESLISYSDKRCMGRGESTSSQTAWALMALLAYLPPKDRAIQNGVDWLLRNQNSADPKPAYEGGVPVPTPRGRTWSEESFTGTGFPNHFYLRYHLYRHYFPLMALGRFAVQARESETAH
jgi:squalene-hopene/tetraprenyl-beta-curcumene cyclase